MKRFAPLTAIFVLALSLAACLSGYIDRTAPQSEAGPASTPVPVEKVLSPFNPITGTDYLMAGIVAAPVGRDASFNPLNWINSSSGYSSSSSGTYNYVFFEQASGQYHRLLPTNDYTIFQTSGFPSQQYDPANPNKPAPVVEYWVFSVIKQNTNTDGYIGYGDKMTIAISDVGGNGYTELIDNVDGLLGQVYQNSASMFIMYNSDKKNYVAKINPSTRELLSTTEFDLGGDVK